MASLQMVDSENGLLEEKIQHTLSEKGLAQPFYVVAREGYVHLIGGVNNLEEKSRVGSWVETIPGVQMVTNHLHVKPWDEKRLKGHF